MSIRLVTALALAALIAAPPSASAQDANKDDQKKAEEPKKEEPKPGTQAPQAEPPKALQSVAPQAAPQGGTAQPQAEPGKKELPKKAPTVRAIVQPEMPLSKRIVLVLDVSGSMNENGKIDRVLEIASEITGQPIDEAEFAVVTFNDAFSRWEGCPEPDANRPVPKGWARLPSDENLKKARAWLSQFPGKGGTEPAGALGEALHEDRDDICIVFVSDGGFTRDPVMKALEDGQKWREEKGRGRAVLMTYGVGIEGENDRENLVQMAKAGKGGFFVDDAPLKAQEKPMRLVSPVPPRHFGQPNGAPNPRFGGGPKKLEDLAPAPPKPDPPKADPKPEEKPKAVAPKEPEPEAGDPDAEPEDPFQGFPH